MLLADTTACAHPASPGKSPIPLSERHYLVMPGLGLAYARVPKAANSTIRYRLAADLGLPRADGLRPNKDAFWDTVPSRTARMLTRRQYAALASDHRPWCFTVVRHPVARLWSAWNNKVVENGDPGRAFEAMGIVAGTGFEEFVARVAATPDPQCDIHVRSQVSMLVLRNRVLPDFIARVESLECDWDRIRAEVRARSGASLGALGAVNVRVGATPELASALDPGTLASIRDRYAQDFARFYPDG